MRSTKDIVMGREKMHRKTTVINYFLVAVVGVGVIAGVKGDRTFTKVYEPIKGIAACFKRLNGTDEIGCRSSSKGDVGVLHVIEDQSSLEWVLKTGPHDPYIAITYPEHFTRENLLQFRASGRVNGVLLLPEKKTEKSEEESTSILKAVRKQMSPFSTDSTCPNNQFGFYNASESEKFCHPWNPSGSALLFENFDFPIFFVRNETEAAALINYYKTFNEPINGTARDWPLCAGQLKSFMMAAKDTPTCLRRSSVFSINPGTTKVCDPLGDQNIVATLLPQGNDTTSNDTKSALVIAARSDGASLFDEISPSADSSITGLVTLLTIIKTLGALKDQLVVSPDAPIDSVYFMLFNGEAFGYIGSSRMAYDMKKGTFPLKLEDIEYFLEINQASPRSSSQSYFIHQSEIGQSKEFTDSLFKQAALQNLTLKISSSPSGVPPSSLHSFLRERSDLTGLVITNHDSSYQNQFYNSIFDTKDNLNYEYGDRSVTSIQQRIASLAATISSTVLQFLQEPGGVPPQPIIADDEMKDTVDELLHCYLETSNCSLFRDIAGFDPAPNSLVEPYPMYVGVATYTNTLTQITHHIMVTYLATTVENVTDKDTCFGRNSGADPSIASRSRYFINNTCYDTPQINMTEAKSPAFIIPGYDWSSGRYSTWTESVWQKFSVRIFLKPSLLHEILTLVSGLLVVLCSFGIARFVNAKSDLIFPSRTDAMVC